MEPTVLLITTNTRYQFLAVSTYSHPSSFLFVIDQRTGVIYFSGIPNIDIFADINDIINHISKLYGAQNIEVRKIGKALIGATISKEDVHQLIICTVTDYFTCATVFGKEIMRVRSVQYVSFLISSKGKQKTYPPPIFNSNSNPFKDFQISDNHFFSFQLDMSVLFPYTTIDGISRIPDSNNHFCWNSRWLHIFRLLRATPACIILFQGYASSMLLDPGNKSNITYILKRSSTNAGTRYFARGLTDSTVPANECECELIFSYNGMFSSHVWRRGSSPVKWTTILSSSISQPQHIVKEDPTEFTPFYFSILFSRFGVKRIEVISLLETRPEKGEYELAEAYKNGCQTSSEILKFPIEYIPFDLNYSLKTNGHKAMLLDLGEKLQTFVSQAGFTSGTEMGEITERQSILFRFNCADSLDRTNTATFFFGLMMTAQYGYKTDGAFLKPNSSPSPDPTEVLLPNVIDSLCRMFLESGDIVSMLYTNTPAIKTNIIRDLLSSGSTTSKEQKSDAQISVMRRYHNVMGDPVKNKLLDQWNAVPIKDFPPFQIFPSYLTSCLEVDGIKKCKLGINPSIICSPTCERPYEFTSSYCHDILVLFPEPLILTGISMLLYPNENESPNLTVNIGNSKESMHCALESIPIPNVINPMWYTFDLSLIYSRSSHFPINIQTLSPHIFVDLHFSCKSVPFQIGSIRFNVQLPHRSIKCAISNDNQMDDALSTYCKVIPEANFTKLAQLCQIEVVRRVMGISDSLRDNILMSRGLNPFTFDLNSRLIPKPGRCYFCEKKLNETDITFFATESKNPFIYNQLQETKLSSYVMQFLEDGHSIPEEYNSYLILCNNCASEFNHGLNESFTNYEIINQNIIPHPLLRTKLMMVIQKINLQGMANIYSVSSGSSDKAYVILSHEIPFNAPLKKDQEFFMTLFFITSVFLQNFTIYLKNPSLFTISAFTPERISLCLSKPKITECEDLIEKPEEISAVKGVTSESKKKNNIGKIEFTILSPLTISGLVFSLKPNEQLENDQIVIGGIELMGDFMSIPIASTHLPKIMRPLILDKQIIDPKFQWDKITRTQTFTFKQPVQISAILLQNGELSDGKKENAIVLFACLFDDEKMIKSLPLLLCHVDEALYFYTNTFFISITSVKIFYMDKLLSVEPYHFNFVIQ